MSRAKAEFPAVVDLHKYVGTLASAEAILGARERALRARQEPTGAEVVRETRAELGELRARLELEADG